MSAAARGLLVVGAAAARGVLVVGAAAARGVLVVGAAAVLLSCQRVEIARPPAADGPSILLVTIDTLRADHVGAYGDEQAETPVLDGLAARGARFETAIAPAPLTLPSHASILSGLYPPRHGVRHNGIFRVEPDTPTLPRVVDDAGYETAAFVGAAVLDREFGLARGFDRYDDDVTGDRASSTGFPERRASAVTDAAISWLSAVDAPYFLWVHYYDPHADYAPPEPWASRFRERPYAGEIAYVDAQLGRLLEAIAARRDGAETIIAVTSDHGEGLGAQGEADHSYLVYDAHLRVPLIVAGPGIAPARHADVVSAASLAPTLLGLAGLPPLPATDVPDLSGLLRGTAAASEGWAYAESLAGRLDHGWSPLHAIRTRTHHYVRGPGAELFDVRADPGQLRDLSESPDPAAREAARTAETHLEAVLAGERPLDPVSLDAERRAQVEALGYVVPEAIPVARAVHPRTGLPFAQLTFEANADLLAGRFGVALAKAERVLERFPDSFRAHDLAARAALQLGDLEVALHHAERGVVLLADRPSAWALLGAVRTRRGERAQAVRAYEEALRRDPDEIEPHLGLLALRLADDPAAFTEQDDARRRALEQDAELTRLAGARPDVLERAGTLWEAAGQDARALAHFERAAKLPGASPSVRQRLAIQYVRQGRAAEAEAALAPLGPSGLDPGLQMHLAIVHASRGERGRAADLLQALLARHPDHEGARKLLARVERERRAEGG